MSRDHTVAGHGTAVLTGDANDENDTYTIHGVAIGSGDVTIGSSGVKKLWPDDELEKAADTLAGKPLVKDHENSVDGVIGRVTRTKFKPGTGVLYEAEISEQFADVAQKIADGLLEVSVRAYHAPTEELEEDEETGAKKTRDIVFDNLAVVPQGAAPSNTAQAGEAAVMSQSIPDLSAAELQEAFDDVDDEENRTDGRPDTSDMPRSDTADAPEWEEGDLVRWQIEPDLFGKIVHVDDEKHVVMVEIMGMEGGDLTSTGFTITAGFSDLKPMQMPESKADMSEHDDMSVSIEDDLDLSELAQLGGLTINGTVMWDDEHMGVIDSLSHSDDGDLVMELGVVEYDDESFSRTGDIVERSLTGSEELEAAWHTPSWDGLAPEREWSKPALEDFDTDDLDEISDHFFVSDTGEWPPENYGDLSLPAVFPDGELSLDGLDSVHSMAPQTDGVSEDMAEAIQSKANELADEHFDQPVAGEEMEQSKHADQPDDEQDDQPITLAQFVDDSPHGSSGTSDAGTITTDTTMKIDYEDIDGDELEDGYVAVNEEALDSVVEKAERADELDSRLDDMNSTLETLSEKTDVLDEVDNDDLDELREHDDPVIVDKESYDAKMEQVDEVGTVFAELLAEEDSIFSAEELTERHSPLELKAKYEDLLDDDESLVDQLGSGDPTPAGDDVETEELEETSDDPDEELDRDAAREYLAQQFESKGYTTQAEEMRQGRIPVEEYEDELGVTFE